MMLQSRLYCHSGGFGRRPVLLPVAGGAVAIVLGAAYGSANVYLSFLGKYVPVALAAAALGVGGTVAVMGVWAHCRNLLFLCLSGLLAGLLAVYSMWVAFLYGLARRSGLDVELGRLATDTTALWTMMRAVNETGWNPPGPDSPSGTLLWIIWTIEAGLLVACIVGLSPLLVRRLVYCEACCRWCKRNRAIARFLLPENSGLPARLADGDWTALASLLPTPPTNEPFIRIDLYECRACRTFAAAEALQVTPLINKRGADVTQRRALSPKLILTRAEKQYLQDLGRAS